MFLDVLELFAYMFTGYLISHVGAPEYEESQRHDCAHRNGNSLVNAIEISRSLLQTQVLTHYSIQNGVHSTSAAEDLAIQMALRMILVGEFRLFLETGSINDGRVGRFLELYTPDREKV